MENKHVGFIILGIGLVLVLIIFLFQSALRDIIDASCNLDAEHALYCPMEKSVQQQTWLSLGIVGILFLIGSVLIFNKPKEKIVIKKISNKRKRIDFTKLESAEKRVVDLLLKENGTMFQAALMEKLSIGKVGLTRLLDKLEAKQIIERKRRGMNNVVVLRG